MPRRTSALRVYRKAKAKHGVGRGAAVRAAFGAFFARRSKRTVTAEAG
jgi:hypothetical protein